MTMKNNAKFEGELTFHFKTDMRNLLEHSKIYKKMLVNLLVNYARKLSS